MQHYYTLFRQKLIISALLSFLVAGTICAQNKPDVIRVKFRSTVLASLKALDNKPMQKSQAGYVKTGIGSIDKLTAAHQVVTMKRVFRPAGKFEARHHQFGLDLWYELKISDKNTAGVNQAVADFKKSEEIEAAETIYEKTLWGYDNPKAAPALSTNDPLFSSQWHYNNNGQTGGTVGSDIKLLDGWDFQQGSNNVIVAVIDGGIDKTHEDLSAAMWINEEEKNGIAGIDDDANGYIDDINGYGFGDNKGDFAPHDHGTHVAGTIGAVSNNGIGVSGVAGGSGSGDGVRLMSCATFGSNSSGGFDEAFVYAADMGAVIAQNSWGYISSGVYEQSVLDAIDYFIANAGKDTEGDQYGPLNGGIVIFAAGNNNSDAQWYPGYYEHVLSVASLNHNSVKAYYSNFGDWVDVSAPGGETIHATEQGVLSTLPGNNYGYFQGTSMACPHVSGLAALIVSEFGGPGITPDLVWNRIVDRADNVDNLNSSFAGMLGSGRINAYSSLAPSDDIPPAPVTDLISTEVLATSAALSWTATGGSGTEGRASGYVIRYSGSMLSEDNFAAGTLVQFPPVPKHSGESELFTVTGLQPHTEYYIALKAIDIDGYFSGISNVAHFVTADAPVIEVSPESYSISLNAGDSVFQGLSVS